jgi:hypothetical protein
MPTTPLREPPFVTVAAFCVGATQNSDGTLSLDRIIDRVTIGPTARQPWIAPLTAVVALRCAPKTATHQLGLQVREPGSRATRPLVSLPVEIGAENRNVARILRFDFQIEALGEYWFDVMWDGEHVTSVGLLAQRSATT